MESSARPGVRGEAVEDYLKAIYELSAAADPGSVGTAQRVGTQDLAQHMRVSPASASRMLKHLDELGYVDHELYRGATLTGAGERAALEVIRHHRLIELYLHDKLGYSWDEVHAEAERLEHYISEEFEARIYDVLGRPEVDPHGDVIPTLEGGLPPERAQSLASQLPLVDAPPESLVVVQRVPSSDPEKLRYLREVGVVPGEQVRVLERLPFGGGVRMRTKTGERTLGEVLASEIRVSQA
ncbi:MAG: metal-dependent transcriptional regulator [Chloroflexota bacterium]|nr:metal-dependent transcriptional regulator [Chloroflexota bacterium]